jgi:hypothetical protein
LKNISLTAVIFLFLKGFLSPSSFRSSHHLDYWGFLLHILLTPLC